MAHDSLRAYITLRVVALAERANDDAARRGRMGELPATDINANMGNASAGSIKEYEIPGLQVALRYRGTYLVLCCRSARQGEAQLLVNIAGESGAIKTLCSGSAGFIRDTDGWFDNGIQLGIRESATGSNRERKGQA